MPRAGLQHLAVGRVGEVRQLLHQLQAVPAGLEDVFVHELQARGLTSPGSLQRGGEAGVSHAARGGA